MKYKSTDYDTSPLCSVICKIRFSYFMKRKFKVSANSANLVFLKAQLYHISEFSRFWKVAFLINLTIYLRQSSEYSVS